MIYDRSETLTDFTPKKSASDRRRMVMSLGPLVLSSGVTLPETRAACHIVGPSDGPVIAVLGGISASRDVAESKAHGKAWWGNLFGPERAVDTKRYRVLSFDFLGGNGETTGPRCPEWSQQNFPEVSTFDQATILERVLKKLEISQIHTFIGASYGGMVGLAMAQRAPHVAQHVVVISAAHKSAPLAVAWRTIQRKIVDLGIAGGNTQQGLALARALAMSTYRTGREFSDRFEGTRTDGDPDSFPIWQYLSSRGKAYTEVMDPQAFLTLSRSIDTHKVEPDKITTKMSFVAVAEDLLVPHSLIEETVGMIRGPCNLYTVESLFGHDAFLKEEDYFARLFRNII